MGRWVPHNLNDEQRRQRRLVCEQLMDRYARENYLDRIICQDEKWVCYQNIIRRGQWVDRGQQPRPIALPDLHPQKILFVAWFDTEGKTFKKY